MILLRFEPKDLDSCSTGHVPGHHRNPLENGRLRHVWISDASLHKFEVPLISVKFWNACTGNLWIFVGYEFYKKPSLGSVTARRCRVSLAFLGAWYGSPEQIGRNMGVSKNRGTTKSSILIGFSIINHPFWDTTIFGNIHIWNNALSHMSNWQVWSRIVEALYEVRMLQSTPFELLLVEEIRNNHLGCIKTWKWWGKLPIHWCRISSINPVTFACHGLNSTVFWQDWCFLHPMSRTMSYLRTKQTPWWRLLHFCRVENRTSRVCRVLEGVPWPGKTLLFT